MRLLTRGAVAGFCGLFAISAFSLGFASDETGKSPKDLWSKLRGAPQDEEEALRWRGKTTVKGFSALRDEDLQKIKNAIAKMPNALQEMIIKLSQQASIVQNKANNVGAKIKKSLGDTAESVKLNLENIFEGFGPLMDQMGEDFNDFIENVSLLIPAKQLLHGLGHTLTLVKQGKPLSLDDPEVKMFTGRIVNVVLVFSSFFAIFFTIATAPLLWAAMLMPLSIFSTVKMSSFAMENEQTWREITDLEERGIIQRTARGGFPVDSASGKKIAAFLRSLTDEELKILAIDNRGLLPENVSLDDFPQKFRSAVDTLFGIENTEHTPEKN